MTQVQIVTTPVTNVSVAAGNAGSRVIVSTAVTRTEPDQIEITPDASIGLESDDIEEAVIELATDIHDINNLPSIALNYQLLRDA